MNEEDAVLIPKNRGEKFSSGFLHSDFLWGGLSRYATTALIFVLSPDHSDITRFLLWSPIATGNHLDRTEKIPNLLWQLTPLTFMIRVQAFRDPVPIWRTVMNGVSFNVNTIGIPNVCTAP